MASSLFIDESAEQVVQNALDQLALKKSNWETFLHTVQDPLSVSRLPSIVEGRTLLHLAILDNRLDVVQILKRDGTLKQKRDAFGLTPLELAEFLDRKEAIRHLQPLAEVTSSEPFEHLSHPIFETKEGFEQVLANVAKAKREDKIPAEKIWMGVYFDKEIRKGIEPLVSIRHIDDEVGSGVFADKKISPCAYVGEYTGVIQERKPSQVKDQIHCLRYTVWEGKKNFVIDASQKGNFTRFINHSAKPNLGLQSVYWRGIPRMIFVALKEIRDQHQLTFDYGPLFWKESKQTPKQFDEV